MARYDGYSSSDYLSPPPPPLHLCFFVSVFFVLGFSWYINYESVLEDLMNQIKFFFMLTLVVLLLIHCCSGNIPKLIPEPEKDSLHREGSSPWGVALVLVLLFYMIS